MGYVYGSIGAVLAIVVSSIGSCIGVGKAGQLAGGFLSKDPSKFTAMLILQLLPATLHSSVHGAFAARNARRRRRSR